MKNAYDRRLLISLVLLMTIVGINAWVRDGMSAFDPTERLHSIEQVPGRKWGLLDKGAVSPLSVQLHGAGYSSTGGAGEFFVKYRRFLYGSNVQMVYFQRFTEDKLVMTYSNNLVDEETEQLLGIIFFDDRDFFQPYRK